MDVSACVLDVQGSAPGGRAAVPATWGLPQTVAYTDARCPRPAHHAEAYRMTKKRNKCRRFHDPLVETSHPGSNVSPSKDSTPRLQTCGVEQVHAEIGSKEFGRVRRSRQSPPNASGLRRLTLASSCSRIPRLLATSCGLSFRPASSLFRMTATGCRPRTMTVPGGRGRCQRMDGGGIESQRRSAGGPEPRDIGPAP